MFVEGENKRMDLRLNVACLCPFQTSDIINCARVQVIDSFAAIVSPNASAMQRVSQGSRQQMRVYVRCSEQHANRKIDLLEARINLVI